MTSIKSNPLYLQVEEFIRKQITSGVYPVDSKLPATAALAAITGTSVCTAQAALSKLCREGLLDRKKGRGTYVKGDKAALTCAGLYFNKFAIGEHFAFYHALGEELRRKLGEKGVKVRIWNDEREEEEKHEPIASLKRAMEKREIQAIIAPLLSGADLSWLQNSPVPTAVFTTDPLIQTGVSSNQLDFLRLGLTELRRQGCRTVGMISNAIVHPNKLDAFGLVFYSGVVDIINELGMEIRNEWIRYPEQKIPNLPQFGYEQFHALWDLQQRPEGLFIFPDVVATGAVTAILERRLSVPQDVKVVFHANDLLPYVCPVKATFLCTEVGRFADALMQMIYTQLEGGEAHPILISNFAIRDSSPFPAS